MLLVAILITSFLAVNAVENIPHVSHVVDVVGRAEVVDVVETLLTLIPMLSPSKKQNLKLFLFYIDMFKQGRATTKTARVTPLSWLRQEIDEKKKSNSLLSSRTQTTVGATSRCY